MTSLIFSGKECGRSVVVNCNKQGPSAYPTVSLRLLGLGVMISDVTCRDPQRENIKAKCLPCQHLPDFSERGKIFIHDVSLCVVPVSSLKVDLSRQGLVTSPVSSHDCSAHDVRNCMENDRKEGGKIVGIFLKKKMLGKGQKIKKGSLKDLCGKGQKKMRRKIRRNSLKKT